MKRNIPRSLLCVIAVLVIPINTLAGAQAKPSAVVVVERPNILWLSTEDIGPQLNCYGDSTAKTPTIDRLANQGVVYDYAWSNYPVCAPARTTIITGIYAAACGAGNMRSSVQLPAGVEMFPHYLRDAGYYCTNNSKEDYNYRQNDHSPWDASSKKAHYRNRAKGQPFFSVFNFTGTHESKIRKRPHQSVIAPADVTLTSYWPDKPAVRRDYAQYYDNLQSMDQWVANQLKTLDESGEANNTIVIFFGDHGSGMPRHKRFAGDSGMRVPFIVHVPDKWKSLVGDDFQAGRHSKRPIGFIDLAPTMLSIAGLQPKPHMQGHAFLGRHIATAPKYLYGFRDRMDERPDISRSIRDEQYIYVRNYMPHLPAGQVLNYQMQTPTTRVWKNLFDAGKLNDVQSAFWRPHPAEELFDLANDPEETINLAADPKLADVLDRFRKEHKQSFLRFGDLGLIPEVTLKTIDDSNTSPRAALENPVSFPLDKIFAVANLAADKSDQGRDELLQAAKSPNPTIAYWGCLGALIDGKPGFDTAASTFVLRVQDANPAVAIVASELTAKFGSDQDKRLALTRLAYFADYRNSNVPGAVAALNAIDRLGQIADPIRESLNSVPRIDPKFKRGKDYIKRMLIAVGAGEGN